MNELFVKAEWKNRILPAYSASEYGLIGHAVNDLPTSLFIDATDHGINGGGAPGFVSVSQGVVDSDDRALRLFALAHETAHCVVPLAFLGVGCVPYQPVGADAKRHEAMADLVAIHVLTDQEPGIAQEICNYANAIAAALGAGGPMHPSGTYRMNAVTRCFNQPGTYQASLRGLALRRINPV